MRHWVWALLICVCVTLGGPGAAQTNQTSVLIIDSERFYAGSAFGQRIQRDVDLLVSQLETENRRIESELIDEESALTEQRPNMDPAEFRILADAFDEKAQRIRGEQIAKLRTLSTQIEEARRNFLIIASPVLDALMEESGAAVMIEAASVFRKSNAADITQEAIRRIDATLGDGTTPMPVEAAPETDQ